jgi:hypothetical protein
VPNLSITIRNFCIAVRHQVWAATGKQLDAPAVLACSLALMEQLPPRAPPPRPPPQAASLPLPDDAPADAESMCAPSGERLIAAIAVRCLAPTLSE